MIQATPRFEARPGRQVLDKQFLFIIGSPRSGTTWLQLMLGSHPSVCATAELTLYDKYVAPWLEAWKTETHLAEEGKSYVGMPVLWDEQEFHGFLSGFLQAAYSKMLTTKPQASHILDKHPGYSQCIETIQHFIPQARFIHLIRDGRDVAVSLFAASRQLRWYSRRPLYAFGEMWKRQVLAARQAAAFPDRYLEVRYEDLSASPAGTLETVFDFCGLSYEQELIDSIVKNHEFENLKQSRCTPAAGVKVPEGHYRQGKAGTWRQSFNAPHRYLFDRIAGDLLRELGYAGTCWWANNPLQKLWVPLLAAAFQGGQLCRRIGPAGAVLFGQKMAVRPPPAFKG
jgi:hypothetical protein